MTHSADSSAIVRLLRFVERRLLSFFDWKKTERIKTIEHELFFKHMRSTSSPLQFWGFAHFFLFRRRLGAGRGWRWGVVFNGDEAILACYSCCPSGLLWDLG